MFINSQFSFSETLMVNQFDLVALKINCLQTI